MCELAHCLAFVVSLKILSRLNLAHVCMANHVQRQYFCSFQSYLYSLFNHRYQIFVSHDARSHSPMHDEKRNMHFWNFKSITETTQIAHHKHFYDELQLFGQIMMLLLLFWFVVTVQNLGHRRMIRTDNYYGPRNHSPINRAS